MTWRVDVYCEPQYGIPLGPRDLNTHPEYECRGDHCVVHNPSDHHMREWKICFRADRNGEVERLCPEHGIGHPDPDDYVFQRMTLGDAAGVHGCCGCCQRKEEE